MATKRTIGIAAAALGVAALVGGGVAFAAQDDPTFDVDAVNLDAVNLDAVDVPTPTDGSSTPPVPNDQQVAALDTVQGTLERRGRDTDDADDLYVGAVELEFGPEAWVRTAGPLEDYDGDGNAEDLLTELDGMVGQPVTALVRLDNDGDDGDVYVLNDLTYRDSAGAPAPWLQGGTASGEAATPEAVAAAAAAAVGEGARVNELDRETAGDVAWEADVTSADGREHTVLLDSAGEVLDTRLDD